MATRLESREARDAVYQACKTFGVYHADKDMGDHNKRAALYALFWAGWNVGRYYPHDEGAMFCAQCMQLAHEGPCVEAGREPGSTIYIDGQALSTECGHSFVTCHTNRCFKSAEAA